MRDKTLIFLHIPKTAGTSIRYILRKNYPSRKRMWIKTSLRGYYLARLDFESRFRNYHCVMGHIDYGVHRYIHNDYQYFTLLRDPIKRVISSYFYFLDKKRHGKKGRRLHRIITSRRMSLEEYVDSNLNPSIYNLQTKKLVGMKDRFGQKNIENEIGEAELARAKYILTEGIRAVGLTEQFDESLVVFKKMFGWKDIRYVRQNISAKNDTEIPERVINRIMECNQYDLQLYALAKELMRKQIENYDGNFQKDLREFREMNSA